MNTHHHPGFNALFAFVDALEEISRELARAARKRVSNQRARTKRGATLRPGPETPLWNALIAMAEPTLRRRGAKATLARELGLHRARVSEYFGRRSSMPDAERALQLLVWLSRQNRAKAA